MAIGHLLGSLLPRARPLLPLSWIRCESPLLEQRSRQGRGGGRDTSDPATAHHHQRSTRHLQAVRPSADDCRSRLCCSSSSPIVFELSRPSSFTVKRRSGLKRHAPPPTHAAHTRRAETTDGHSTGRRGHSTTDSGLWTTVPPAHVAASFVSTRPRVVRCAFCGPRSSEHP